MVKSNKTIWFSVCLALLFSVSLAAPAGAQTATLYLLPSTGNYTVGTTFSVTVKVSSGGIPINAAEGSLIFNTEELNVVSLSKSGSIFSLWTTEPTFSNSAGTIEFGGGTPASFTGAAGTMVTITFKAKKSATANVNFLSGAVLAADGKGTNVLANMTSGTYTLTPGIITPPAEEVSPKEYVAPPTVGVPAAPVVSSTTHPDENKWYSNNDPEFNWSLPSGVTGVSLLLHKSPTANPGNVSDGLLESKKYESIEDGIWYFNIKFRNQYGWGAILHRKVLIDTRPPLPFEIKVQREDPTDPQPVLLFETTDETSGIEYYEVKIGQGEPFPAEKIKTESYKLPPQALGIHEIEVKAFDKAGNYARASTEIEVLPIETPRITKFPLGLMPGQNLILEGESLPEATIKVFIQKEKAQPVIEEVKADQEGKWSFISSEPLEGGDYEVLVQAQDERGALSLSTEKISFWAGLPPFLRFGKIAIDYASVMVTLIVLIAVAIGVIFYTWYRISLWRKRVSKETKEVAQSVTAAFRALREEVEEQISMLDKKPGLTKEEKAIRDKLQEALDVSEQFIGKELKDVEKELE